MINFSSTKGRIETLEEKVRVLEEILEELLACVEIKIILANNEE